MIRHIDFGRVVLHEPRLVSLSVLYYMPDHRHLLNEFLYQLMDDVPGLPRVHRFLGFWAANIEAVIKEVSISHAGPMAPDWRHGVLIKAN